MTTPIKNPHVAVFGLGYVGCVSAACLADMGYHVVGIDRDESKVGNILKGVAPFFEPGLEAVVARTVSAGRLMATTNVEAVIDADIALICVGTPSEKNGNIGLDQLRRVIEHIASTVPSRVKPLIVAVRSTVFPGTCEELVMPAFHTSSLVSVVANPEFLREGTALRDFMHPSLVVVGGDDPKAVNQVANLYAPLPKPVSRVDLRTAEMIKYACNAFHAVKVAFANEIGTVSAHLGLNPGEVMATLCQDEKLNISSAYLRPGFAFGGSCLPKDLRALTYCAKRLDLQAPLLNSVLSSNDQHLERALDTILNLSSARLGIIGLAFKENTDDLRESPVVRVLEVLIGKGRKVRIFDPHIQWEGIYGSNRNFVLRQIPHIGQLIDGHIDQTLAWAGQLIVTQKLSPGLEARVIESGLPILDLVAPSLDYLVAPKADYAAAGV